MSARRDTFRWSSRKCYFNDEDTERPAVLDDLTRASERDEPRHAELLGRVALPELLAQRRVVAELDLVHDGVREDLLELKSEIGRAQLVVREAGVDRTEDVGIVEVVLTPATASWKARQLKGHGGASWCASSRLRLTRSHENARPFSRDKHRNTNYRVEGLTHAVIAEFGRPLDSAMRSIIITLRDRDVDVRGIDVLLRATFADPGLGKHLTSRSIQRMFRAGRGSLP
jgi:hypothetical protein